MFPASSGLRVRQVSCAVLGFILGAILAPAARGATLVVTNREGSGCSDKGDGIGSESRPFCSLQMAVDRARPGDHVIVRGGTYGPGRLDIAVSGSRREPIVIRSEPPRQSVLIGPEGAGESRGPAVRISGSHIVLEGFEVRDSAGTGIRNGGDHVTIRGNYVHHNARRCDPAKVDKCGQGIASTGSTHNVGVLIEGNVSAYNGSGGRAMDHGFYLNGPEMIVRNNIAVGSDDFGFHIYPDCDRCLIQNNVAWANGRSGFLVGGDDSFDARSSNVILANNISASNGQAGFAFYQPGKETIRMRSNIAHGNTRGALEIPEGWGGLDNSGLIRLDPRFVNPAGLDFHLEAGSPAIDAGDADLAAMEDLDGDRRPLGAGVDIGADEVRP